MRTSDPGANVTAAVAVARTRSEGATLAVAVAVAVALGVACGVWINSLLAASAASAGRAAPSSRTPSEVRADTPTPPDKTETPHESDETAEVSAEPTATVVESRTLKPAATPAPTPNGREAKTDARAAVAPEVLKGAEPLRKQGRPAPCALYASASALTIRGGGAAFLVLGGPGESGAVNVSTPSWADIAVFREGPAAGGNGWVRYMVKSVSRRPGLYAIHFSTRCGSQTIPVTVK